MKKIKRLAALGVAASILMGGAVLTSSVDDSNDNIFSSKTSKVYASDVHTSPHPGANGNPNISSTERWVFLNMQDIEDRKFMARHAPEIQKWVTTFGGERVPPVNTQAFWDFFDRKCKGIIAFYSINFPRNLVTWSNQGTNPLCTLKNAPYYACDYSATNYKRVVKPANRGGDYPFGTNMVPNIVPDNDWAALTNSRIFEDVERGQGRDHWKYTTNAYCASDQPGIPPITPTPPSGENDLCILDGVPQPFRKDDPRCKLTDPCDSPWIEGGLYARLCTDKKKAECEAHDNITFEGLNGTFVSPDPKFEVRNKTIEGDIWGHTWITPQKAALDNTLEPQDGGERATPFKAFTEQVSQGQHQGIAAISGHGGDKADTTAPPLSKTNRRGMGFGGVLNFKSKTQHAKVTGQDEKCTWVSSARHHSVYEPGTCRTCSNGSCTYYSCPKYKGEWFDGWNFSNSEIKMSWVHDRETPYKKAFWQMLSVHCNQKDFKQILSEDSDKIATVTNDPEKNGALFGSFITKDVGAPYFGVTPGNIAEGGDKYKAAYSKLSGAKKSGTRTFFDKECPFDCEKKVSPDWTSGTGQLSANGNNNDHGNKGNALTGTNNNNINSNYVEIFRDNQFTTIYIPTWTPKNNSTVSNSNQKPAITTTIARWKEGTPSPWNKSKGYWNLYNDDLKTGKKKGLEFFTTKDLKKVEIAPTQTNFDGTPWNGGNTAIVNDYINTFYTKATWASDQGKPNIVNIKWEFDPKVRSPFWDKSDMINNDSGTRVDDNFGEIQGKCYANFGTDTSEDTTDVFYNNTGTKIPNHLDSSVYPCANNLDKPALCRHNLVINTIRSTTR